MRRLLIALLTMHAWGAPDPTEIIFTAKMQLSFAAPEDSVRRETIPRQRLQGLFIAIR